jgi:hypothetical protein
VGEIKEEVSIIAINLISIVLYGYAMMNGIRIARLGWHHWRGTGGAARFWEGFMLFGVLFPSLMALSFFGIVATFLICRYVVGLLIGG